jgi:hypothetical protein
MEFICSRCSKTYKCARQPVVKRCEACRKAEEIEKLDRSRKKEFIRYMESNPRYFRMIAGTKPKTPAQLFREVIDARIKWYDEGLKEAMRMKHFRLQASS